jgi:hypothetical protein
MTFARYIEFDAPCQVFGDLSAEGTFELLLPRSTGA